MASTSTVSITAPHSPINKIFLIIQYKSIDLLILSLCHWCLVISLLKFAGSSPIIAWFPLLDIYLPHFLMICVMKCGIPKNADKEASGAAWLVNQNIISHH